ncbi:MAG: sodium:proton antiporter [Saprospiraceae bacterium]|jgi:CPA1 family monovalent cation:H+ antiporter|nr:sodium:proton antiporter [Saprospiraceae bacterium]
MYESFSIIFAISALLSFINYKWLKLPSTIGQMILALGVALLIIGSEPFLPNVYNYFCGIVQTADFTHVLLDIMLGFLLFAGALHVDISNLKKERWAVLVFATIGVLISTFLVGTGLHYITVFLGCTIPYLHCLLFGALISPTDPIAVLALLKSSKVSKSLQLKIEGESLFNDGIGVIVFTALLLFTGMDEMIGDGEETHRVAFQIMELFFEEVIFGLVLGGVLGYLAFRLMKSAEEDHFLSSIISLAIVFGGYSLAKIFHTSGPLAMVVAGLYIGHKIKSPDFNKKTKETLVGFWHVLDESLNGVLFVFIGLAAHLVVLQSNQILLAFCSIVLVLLARFISVIVPYSLLKHTEHSWLNTSYVLTWGGLKGGISLALALSLAPELSKDTLLLLTYTIVIFSIIIQGLTISKLTKRLDS